MMLRMVIVPSGLLWYVLICTCSSYVYIENLWTASRVCISSCRCFAAKMHSAARSIGMPASCLFQIAWATGWVNLRLRLCRLRAEVTSFPQIAITLMKIPEREKQTSGADNNLFTYASDSQTDACVEMWPKYWPELGKKWQRICQCFSIFLGL